MAMCDTKLYLAYLLPLILGAEVFVVSAFGQAFLAPTADSQQDAKQQKLAREAKITLDQAREIALKRMPGKIESEELERERWVLVYSFDIRTKKGITEVQVNAVNGRIVSVERESRKKEEAEKKKEQQEKKRQ